MANSPHMPTRLAGAWAVTERRAAAGRGRGEIDETEGRKALEEVAMALTVTPGALGRAVEVAADYEPSSHVPIEQRRQIGEHPVHGRDGVAPLHHAVGADEH